MTQIKKIKDYPDYYVSSAGNVWREKNNGFYLKLRPDKQGIVQLCTNGKAKSMLVYRLVAQAFVQVPEQYRGTSVEELEVHHINFNHNDNLASNLMWLTKTEHMKLHSESEVTFARKSAAKINRSDLSKAVMQFTKTGDFVASYASIHEAARQTKVNHGQICSCCSGNRNYAGGFVWRYVA